MSGRRRQGSLILAGLAEGMVAAACGSTTKAPTTPTSNVPSAFIYALDAPGDRYLPGRADSLTVFDASSESELRPRASLSLPSGRLLTPDPGGRFLYAATTQGVDWSFDRYSIDRQTGTLTLLDRNRYPRPYSDTNLVAMAANEAQLHVLIQAGVPYQSIRGRWVTFTLDPTRGVVTESPASTYRFYDPLWVVAESANRFVYVGTAYPSYEWTLACDSPWCVGAFAFATEPDGHLRQVGSAGVPTLNGEGNAAVLAGRYLIVPDDNGGLTAFAMDPNTGGLVPGPTLQAAFERYQSARLAYGGGMVALASPTLLSLFALGPDGTLALRDQRPLPPSPSPEFARFAGYVAFHPSGRYLYLSRPGQGVQAFYVGSDGRLTEGATVTQGGGPIVVVAPPR